jgi:hypothetical protein
VDTSFWPLYTSLPSSSGAEPSARQTLEDEGVTLEGVKIWGSPVTPTFEDWSFTHGPAAISTYWDAISDDTDVLITHGPAYGVLDRVRTHGEQFGCPRLRHALDTRLRLKLHVFGHVHEDWLSRRTTLRVHAISGPAFCDSESRDSCSPFCGNAVAIASLFSNR